MAPLCRSSVLKPKSSRSILQGTHHSFSEDVLPHLFVRPNWSALPETIGSDTPRAGEKSNQVFHSSVCWIVSIQPPQITYASSSFQSKVKNSMGEVSSITSFSCSPNQPIRPIRPIKRCQELQGFRRWSSPAHWWFTFLLMRSQPGPTSLTGHTSSLGSCESHFTEAARYLFCS